MLGSYSGTIIAVSHDRFFINKITDRILVFGKDKVSFYPYGYAELEEKEKAAETKNISDPGRGDFREMSKGKPLVSAPSTAAALDREAFKERSRKEKLLKKTEKMMEQCERDAEDIGRQLEDPENSGDYVLLSKLHDELIMINEKLDKYTEEWVELSEELEP